jgi:hypothetical protein
MGDQKTISRPMRGGWATNVVFLLALLAMCAMTYWQYLYAWSPLERFYKITYAQTWLRSWIFPGSSDTYPVYFVETSRHEERIADKEEVEYAVDPAQGPIYALSDQAREEGWTDLTAVKDDHVNSELRDALSSLVYWDQKQYTMRSLYVGLGVFLVGALWSIPKDRRYHDGLKYGHQIGGTELVSAFEFNKKMRVRKGLRWLWPDGIRIIQQQSWLNKLTRGVFFIRRPLCLRREDEVTHIAIMGDTGTGKTVLINQILAQVSDRGDTAVVHDPDGKLASIFFNAERGDVILDPTDERFPGWSPGNEVSADAEYEADSLAASLFPVHKHQDSKDKYFNQWAAAAFAHLLKYRPTPQQLLFWMRDRAELDRRIRGTGIDTAIDKESPDQRGGIVSTLNIARLALEYLPDVKEAQRQWSIREWSKTRRGWIFLTSRPMTEAPLCPLVSMWFDQIILRLMMRPGHPQKTWIVLDELGSLQHLPRLESGLTRCRKANVSMVLGLQGKAQIDNLYGPVAETMMSQPAVKVFMRSNHADVAEWVSRNIGKRYMERYRTAETSSSSTQKSVTEQMQPDQYTEDAVNAGKIKGSKNLHAYLTFENYVVPLLLEPLELPISHPEHLPRKMRSAIQPQTETPSKRPYFE